MQDEYIKNDHQMVCAGLFPWKRDLYYPIVNAQLPRKFMWQLLFFKEFPCWKRKVDSHVVAGKVFHLL